MTKTTTIKDGATTTTIRVKDGKRRRSITHKNEDGSVTRTVTTSWTIPAPEPKLPAKKAKKVTTLSGGPGTPAHVRRSKA